jgi:hypothetical protein
LFEEFDEFDAVLVADQFEQNWHHGLAVFQDVQYFFSVVLEQFKELFRVF